MQLFVVPWAPVPVLFLFFSAAVHVLCSVLFLVLLLVLVPVLTFWLVQFGPRVRPPLGVFFVFLVLFVLLCFGPPGSGFVCLAL